MSESANVDLSVLIMKEGFWTCRACTDEQRGSRTRLHPEPPTQCRNGRYSGSRKDPEGNETDALEESYLNLCLRKMKGSTHPQAWDFGQQVLLRNLHLVHEDHSCGRGSQRELPLDLGRGEALHATLQDETADFSILTFSPDHRDVCHWRVGDPEGRVMLVTCLCLTDEDRTRKVERSKNIECLKKKKKSRNFLKNIFSGKYCFATNRLSPNK